jgi:hypothetical protein
MAIFNSYVKLPEGKYVEHCGVLIEDVVNHGKSLYSIYIYIIHTYPLKKTEDRTCKYGHVVNHGKPLCKYPMSNVELRCLDRT